MAAHRIAYLIEHGVDPGELLIRHSCDRGNEACVNPKHLLLGTHADNMRDMLERNRHSKGESHGQTTVTTEDVRAMRRFHQESGLSMKAAGEALSERFPSMKARSITSILQGRTWQSVTLDGSAEYVPPPTSGNGGAKLTAQEIQEMRQRFADNNTMSAFQMAQILHSDYPQVSRHTIYKTLRGDAWKDEETIKAFSHPSTAN